MFPPPRMPLPVLLVSLPPVFIRFYEPLPLASGQSLPSYELAVETYGVLNDQRSNAGLPCFERIAPCGGNRQG